MKHVFIAVGGSGTKVAEALIKLLTIGFPTQINKNGEITSFGDSLEIWRIDPDRSSGAVQELNNSLTQYRLLQNSLNDNGDQYSFAESPWAMKVETTVKDLNPLELPKANPKDNQIKTLSGILNSRYSRELEDSLPLLYPFYEEKDLDVPIDEGFYQKPFIGSAIMAIFAQSLEQAAASNENNHAWIKAFDNSETNFFLCGSLHGGTGASGVPVMARFLKQRKTGNADWRIGGCMLMPYFRPPSPPFEKPEGELITRENLSEKTEEYFGRIRNERAFDGADDDQVKKIIRLILQGYYAKPDEIMARAKQGLDYYRRYAANFFDEMYLIGKPSPNQLVNWSNGGSSQQNPLNSTEVVAAISALNFFAGNKLGDKSSYVVASSAEEIDSERMRLANLPSYEIGRNIEPEKVFLSSALLYFLVSHQLPWEKVHESVDKYKLFSQYKNNLGKARIDQNNYQQALRIIRNTMVDLLEPHQAEHPTGWSTADVQDLNNFFERRTEKILFFGTREVRPVQLGNSEINDRIFSEFISWCPEGNFSCGKYLRNVWSQIYSKCQSRRNV